MCWDARGSCLLAKVRPVAAIAADRNASTTYVQNLRNGVCAIAYELQAKSLRQLPDHTKAAAVLELAFDETEFKVSIADHLAT